MPTIREAVEALEERLFVGRAQDLETFERWLGPDDGGAPQLLNVHGPGGVGKSALLGAFRRVSERAGRPVVTIDGRSVPPTPEDFLSAATGGSIAPPRRGRGASTPSGSFADAMARLNGSRPLVSASSWPVGSRWAPDGATGRRSSARCSCGACRPTT